MDAIIVLSGTLWAAGYPSSGRVEVTSGRGDIVDWLGMKESRAALILNEDLDPVPVADTIMAGYEALA